MPLLENLSDIVHVFLTSAKIVLLLGLVSAIGGLGLFGWSSYKDSKYWQGEAARIQLESDQRAKLFVSGNRIISKSRVGANEVSTSNYVPPEAPPSEIIVPEDPSKPLIINVKTKGFCLRPGWGALFAHNKGQIAVDLKLIYYYRLGGTLGFASRGPLVGLSRHLDDLPRSLGLPWLRMPNLELYGGLQPATWEEICGRGGTNGKGWFIGLRSNW